MRRRRYWEIGGSVALASALVLALGAFFYQKSLNDALALALDRQEMHRIKALIRKGALAKTRSPRGNTALIWAAVWPDPQFVGELLDRGADVNAQNDGGQTALMVAAAWGHVEVVRILVERGADPT